MTEESSFQSMQDNTFNQLILKAFQLIIMEQGEKGIKLSLKDFTSSKLNGKCIRIDPDPEYLKFTVVHDPRN